MQTSISQLGDVVRETELIGLENVLGRITARPINVSDRSGQQLVGREKAFGIEAVSAGVALQVCHLPILATAGITIVEVFARLRVGLITLPDQRSCNDFSQSTCELSPGAPLRGLVESLGAGVYETRLPNATSATLGSTLQLMLSNYPLVLISGFLTPGQSSTLHDALCERGAIASVQDVVMRPIGSVQIGRAGDRLVVALSSDFGMAFSTFVLLLSPLVRRMQGRATSVHEPVTASLASIAECSIDQWGPFPAREISSYGLSPPVLETCLTDEPALGLANATGLAWKAFPARPSDSQAVAFYPFHQWLG